MTERTCGFAHGLPTCFHMGRQDEADKKALQSIVENNAEGSALYRDLTHDFAHHADVFKKSPGHDDEPSRENSDDFDGLICLIRFGTRVAIDT